MIKYNVYMKNTVYIILAAVLLVGFAGCAPKKPPVKPPEPGQELFEEAGDKYDESEYSKALELYQQIIDKYPDTSYAREAQIKILESYDAQGRFRDVIRYRQKIPDEKLDPRMRLRANLLAGDAHMALEQFRSAYKTFSEAYREAEKDRRPELAERLLSTVSLLEPEFIDSEIKRLETEPPAGFLLYQQGVNFIAEQRLGDAESVFRRFLEYFPEHPIADRTEEQIAWVTSATFFEGHTIGCVLPLSGKYEKFGRQALRGIELALAEASGRMEADPPFKLLVRDSASEPEKADRVVRELAEKKVSAVIGPIESASEAAQTAQKMGVPIIVLSQQGDIVDTGDYVFRNFLTAEMQVSALVDYVTGEMGCRRFAVLYPDEPYGEFFLHLFWDKLIEKNARLMGAESYNPEQTDFSEPIKKLVGLYYELPADLKSKPMPPGRIELLLRAIGLKGGPFPGDLFPELEDFRSDHYDFRFPDERMLDEQEPKVDFEALFIPDSPAKAGLIIPQLRFYDIKNIHLLGTNLWHSQRLIDIAGDQIQSAVIPEGFFLQSQRRHVREFVGKFEDVYGYKPGFLEAVGYDTAMILCRQISDKSVFTRPALQKSLVQMPSYKGVTGSTEFLDTGEADKKLYLLNLSGGRFIEINR